MTLQDYIQKDIERLEVFLKEVDVPIGDYGHYSVEGMIESTVQSLIDIKRKELEELNKKMDDIIEADIIKRLVTFPDSEYKNDTHSETVNVELNEKV